MYTDTGGVVTRDQRYKVRRRQPRFLFSVPVSISRLGESGQPVIHGLSLDLSGSGASALLCGPATVGETVCLSLQFPEAPVESLAIVRHSDSTRSGFEFVEFGSGPPKTASGAASDVADTALGVWAVRSSFRPLTS